MTLVETAEPKSAHRQMQKCSRAGCDRWVKTSHPYPLCGEHLAQKLRRDRRQENLSEYRAKQPSIVRAASIGDGQELWRLLMMAHKENGLFTLSPDKVAWWLERILNPQAIPQWDTGPRGVMGVIGEPGRLEGLAFVIIGEWWYSRDKHLEELIVYIDPACRVSSHANALVTWMKRQAEQSGVPLVSGVISNQRTESKCRLYSRMLEKVGEFYVWNLTPLSSAAA